jgi:glucose uptake protein
MVPGLFQGAGNLFFIISALLNGTAIAAPLNQLNIIVGTLLGIFLLKEKKEYPYGIITYMGLVLITFGALSIGFMNQILKIN